MADNTGSAGAVAGAAQANAAAATTTGETTGSSNTIDLNEKVASFDAIPEKIKYAMMEGMAANFINKSYSDNQRLIQHMKEAQRAADGG